MRWPSARGGSIRPPPLVGDHGQGHVDVGVAQDQVVVACPSSGPVLGHLPIDPDRTSRPIRSESIRDGPARGGRLGTRLQRHAGQPARTLTMSACLKRRRSCWPLRGLLRADRRCRHRQVPGAVRRPRSTCASRSCTTSSWSNPRGRGAVFVDEVEEVPERCRRRLLRPRSRARGRGSRPARRNLKTIPRVPLSAKVHDSGSRARATRSSSSATRGTRSIGAFRRGAGSMTIVEDHLAAATVEVPAVTVHLALPDHALGRRGTQHGRKRSRSGSNLMSPPQRRHLLRHLQRRGQGHRRALRCRHRRRLGQLVQLGDHLVEVALAAVPGRPYRVDYAAELDPEWFVHARTVGVTSGASVPEILVNDVLAG